MAGPEHAPTHERKQHSGNQPERYQGAPRSRELDRHTESNGPEKARHALAEASKEAISHTEYNVADNKQESEASAPPAPSKKGLQQSFNKTMQQTRSNMSTPSRVFSKVIHSPIVERASDIVGSTVARPTAILSGSFFAFVCTLVIYVIAKYAGFEITGSIAMASFAAGWLFGILIDIVRGLFRNKR